MKPPVPTAPGVTPASAAPLPAALPELPWHARLNVLNVTFILFLLLIVFSLPALRGSGREIDYLGNFLSVAGSFLPPDFSDWREMLAALFDTARIAVLATAGALVLSLPVAAAGARTLSPRWLVAITRLFMNAIRTVPSLIWALVAVAVVGANSLAGVAALALYSVGYLGKFFSDAFESVETDGARALRAIGASPFQAFQHGLWPHAKPLVWSQALWMLEYNLRSAAIVGYVGAGGVGVLLHSYFESFQRGKFAAVLLIILVLVTLLDLLGEWVRGKVVRRMSGKPLAVA